MNHAYILYCTYMIPRTSGRRNGAMRSRNKKRAIVMLLVIHIGKENDGENEYEYEDGKLVLTLGMIGVRIPRI